MNKISNINFIFIYCILINLFKLIFSIECEYNSPILKESKCIEGQCLPAEFQSKICIINNPLIKVQWLNNIIPISDTNFTYVDILTMSNGDLIIETSSFPSQLKRMFYGLKKNGRSYFRYKERKTSYYTINTTKARYESFIFGVKINGTEDNKEYLFSVPKDSDKSCELYDFENNSLYEVDLRTFFGVQTFTFDTKVVKLTSNSDYYILGICGTKWEPKATYYFYLMKLLFTSKDIVKFNPIINSTRTYSSNSRFISCFESKSKYIICFYQSAALYYVIGIYDQNLNYITSKNITQGISSQTIFFKGIHYKEDVGAFGFYSEINEEYIFHIILKEYDISNNIIHDYIGNIPLIKINKGENPNPEGLLNDMIKLSDTKICFISFSNDKKILKIAIINNFSDNKIIIRYYFSNIYNLYLFKAQVELGISLYNNFIAMAFSAKNEYDSRKSYLIIFSYPNSTDFETVLSDNVKSFTNYVVNLREKCTIENNLFGYIFYGIKIVGFSHGYQLLSKNKRFKIKVGDILIDEDDKVEFVINKKVNLTQRGRIKFSMVLSEPNYNESNQYSTIIDKGYCNSCDDEEEIYNNNKNKFIGRVSYHTIIIDPDILTTDCKNENCAYCLKEDLTCITCKYSFKLSDDETTKICLSNETDNIELISTELEVSESASINSKSTIISESIISELISTNSFINELNIEDTVLDISEIKTNENNINNCTTDEIIKNKCQNGVVSLNQIKEIKKNLLNDNYIENKTNTIIKTENIIIQLSTLEDQKESDIPDVSNIDLGDCENMIKDANGIPRSEQLIIYKTDIKAEDLSTTYVQYEVYHPNTLKKLNLSVCNEVQVSINVPVELYENIEILYDSLSQSGYNIFDKNDSFYQDICSTYTTINGTDILLSDRKKDIYTQSQNQIICQNNCEIKSYNPNTKKAKCDCSINEHTEESLENLLIKDLFSKNIIENKFYKTLKNSNFRVMKCYKLLLKNIIKNIGEIMMTIIFFLFMILMIIFCITGQKRINNYINFFLTKSQIYDNKRRKGKFRNNKKRNNIKKKAKNLSLFHKKEKPQKPIEKEKEEPPKKSKTKNYETKNANKDIKTIKNSKTKDLKGNLNHIFKDNIFLNVNLINSENKMKKKKNKKIDTKIKRESFDLKPKFIISKKGLFQRKSYKYRSAKVELNDNSKEELHRNKSKLDFYNLKYRLLNDQELNTLEYNVAIELDRRSYFQYYFSLLKKKHLILFTFIPINDYNLMTIKISLFLITFSLYLSINGFFFTDAEMQKTYKNNGIYNIIIQIPKILYSTIISSIINIILKSLSLSENNILELKEITNYEKKLKKSEEIKYSLKIKFFIFYILSFLIMGFLWYFISCFCAVYKNTQIILIKDSIISFCLSMIYPFGLNLIPGFLRIPALRAKNKNKICLYKTSLIVALI